MAAEKTCFRSELLSQDTSLWLPLVTAVYMWLIQLGFFQWHPAGCWWLRTRETLCCQANLMLSHNVLDWVAIWQWLAWPLSWLTSRAFLWYCATNWRASTSSPGNSESQPRRMTLAKISLWPDFNLSASYLCGLKNAGVLNSFCAS